MLTLKTLLVSIMLVMPATFVEANTLILGFDLSGSSPLSNKQFAKRAADKAAKEVIRMKPGDTLLIRAFGVHSGRQTSIARDFRITRKVKATAVAKVVKRFVISIPDLNIVNEPQTSLIGFLISMGTAYDCQNGVRYILLSDGVEDSSYGSSRKIAQHGGAFSEIDSVNFKSCQLDIWGFGLGFDAVTVEQFKKATISWARAEGFGTINLLNNW